MVSHRVRMISRRTKRHIQIITVRVCACVCMCTPTKMVLVGTQKPLRLIGRTLSGAAVSSICGNLLLAPALR